MLQPIKISRKPVSVNEAFTGRRWKTDIYRAYVKAIVPQLPAFKLPPPPYVLYIDAGQSNDGADFDNPVKPFVDCLQMKYKAQGFNDKQIRRAIVDKTIVPKGEEYIAFQLQTYVPERMQEFLLSKCY